VGTLTSWNPLGHSRPVTGLLYLYENWSLTLKEEHLLRVFQSKVLRRIFGPKRDEVAGEWRELYNEELNELYSSPNTIRVMKF